MTLFIVVVSHSCQPDSVWTDRAGAESRREAISGLILPYEANHAPRVPGGTVCECGEPVYLECKTMEGAKRE